MPARQMIEIHVPILFTGRLVAPNDLIEKNMDLHDAFAASAGKIELGLGNLWVASFELVVRGRGDNCAAARFCGLLLWAYLYGVLSFEKKLMDLF
ncbi:hypothetical protein JTB14_001838 [Gonioctena quinquepunctata]|nr:hypothetical protein JTB14_001838 [Gonioctena quinquepunctata]